MFNWFKHGKLERSEGSSITEGIGQGRVTENMKGAPIDDAMTVLDTDVVEMVGMIGFFITVHCNTQIKTINGGQRLFHYKVTVMNKRARREDVRLFDKVFQ